MSVTIILDHGIVFRFMCKFLEDGAFSARIAPNKSGWNCIESTCRPKSRVSAAMFERHTCVIVRESHSSKSNLPLAPRDTSGFSPMKIPIPACEQVLTLHLWDSRTDRHFPNLHRTLRWVHTRSSQGHEKSKFLDLVCHFICFQQISQAGLSLSSLEHFHDELKWMEQFLCYPLQTSVDASELMT